MSGRRALFWAALAAGLALRGGYAYYAQSRGLVPTTVDGYESIAMSLLARGEYVAQPGVATASREPAYPLLIAAVYRGLGGRSPWAILALQCLLGVATGYFCCRIAEGLFGEAAGLMALWAYMLYPQAIYYCGYYYRETLDAFLVGALALSSLWWARPGRGWKADAPAWLGGLAAAGAALANSALAPAAVLCAGGMLAAARGCRLRRMLYFSAPVVLGLAAWTARNYRAQGRLVLGSTHGGEEFYQALIVPPADLGTPRHTAILNADSIYKGSDSLPEAQRNALLMSASFHWIAAHPAVYASRAATGVFKFWRLWPYPRRYDHPFWILVLLSLLSDGWIVPLGLVALWRYRARWRSAPAAPIAVVATTLVYGLIHAVIRYRLPLMPIIAAFSGGLAAELLGFDVKGESR